MNYYLDMIRTAEEKDTKAVQELIELLEDCTFDSENFARIFRDQLADERWTCFVYEKEGEILACLNMRMEEQLHHCAKVAQILELIVKEDKRCQGIGAQLFRTACDHASENGCVQVELETSSWRKRAHAFYEREGMNDDHSFFTMKLK